jgi:hypothetical protein
VKPVEGLLEPDGDLADETEVVGCELGGSEPKGIVQATPTRMIAVKTARTPRHLASALDGGFFWYLRSARFRVRKAIRARIAKNTNDAIGVSTPSLRSRNPLTTLAR